MEMRWQEIKRGGAAVAVIAAALAFAATAAVASGQPVARAAGSCSPGKNAFKLGPTYVESLSVSHTNCSTGENVIKAYNHCRLKAGGAKGHCNSKVMGYKCTEKRSSGPVQFIAKTHCTAGRAVVNFTYSEND